MHGYSRRWLDIHIAMSTSPDQAADLVFDSFLYKEFLAEREEILRHKWLESEKAGQDIGLDKAQLNWIFKFRSSWRAHRQRPPGN